MVAAHILAGELRRCGDEYAEAFRRYQDLFGPFVLAKQRAALRFAGSFAPTSKLTLFLRNQLFKLMAIRWIADLAVGRDLADKIVSRLTDEWAIRRAGRHELVRQQALFRVARAKANPVSAPTIIHCTAVNAVSITR